MLLRGKTLVVLGSLLIVAATLFTAVLPSISYQVVSASTPEGQQFLLGVQFVSNLLGTIMPAAGAAFLGAGLLVLYLERQRPDSASAEDARRT